MGRNKNTFSYLGEGAGAVRAMRRGRRPGTPRLCGVAGCKPGDRDRGRDRERDAQSVCTPDGRRSPAQPRRHTRDEEMSARCPRAFLSAHGAAPAAFTSSPSWEQHGVLQTGLRGDSDLGKPRKRWRNAGPRGQGLGPWQPGCSPLSPRGPSPSARSSRASPNHEPVFLRAK